MSLVNVPPVSDVFDAARTWRLLNAKAGTILAKEWDEQQSWYNPVSPRSPELIEEGRRIVEERDRAVATIKLYGLAVAAYAERNNINSAPLVLFVQDFELAYFLGAESVLARVLSLAEKGDPSTEGSEATKCKRRRRGGKAKGLTPLTQKQTEAMHLVGEHKGDFTAAAKAAGKSRQAMRKLYGKACLKLGKANMQKLPKTQRLPTDSRGQTMVTIPDDDE